MSDSKISALTALDQPSVDSTNDALPIVDASASLTKKIAPSILVGAVLGAVVAATPSSRDVAGNSVYVPTPVTMTDRASGAALNACYYGPAQVTTNDGNKRAKFFSTLKAAPASLGDHSSIDTSFNGDLSGQLFSIEHRITGTNTLGNPATGFTWVPEASAMYIAFRNASGWNQSTSQNDGRTGVSAIRIKTYSAGQGGTGVLSFSSFLGTAGNVSNTSFLANPASFALCGDMFAGVDGVYMDPIETTLNDNGHDAAAIGHVMNFNRTNNTGALYAWWAGIRVQSQGTKPMNVVYSASGKADIGLDLSFLDHSASSATYTSAAITLKADQRIYGNATASDSSGLSRFPSSPGNAYFFYSSSLSAWNLVASNTSVLQVYGTPNIIALAPMHIGQNSADYMTFAGGTGVTTFGVAGTSTDIGINYISKGAGTHSFQTNGGTKQFEILNVASSVNYIQAAGSATTNAVSMTAVGTDTNINFKIQGKGSGLVLFASNGANQVQVAGPSNAVNQVQLQGSITTGPVIVGAAGTATDLDVQISPKGAGLLRYGTYVVKSAEAFTGYITINDSGGTARKVMVCA